METFAPKKIVSRRLPPSRHLRGLRRRFSGTAGNTKVGNITVPLTSCLTGLESTTSYCSFRCCIVNGMQQV